LSEALQALVVSVSTFLAAGGGFWVYWRKRTQEKDSSYKLLLGLTHYKIVELGMYYIDKGFVTKDEYDDLVRYFWDPYLDLGGNGSAERIMRLVQRLPLTLQNSRIAEIADQARLRATDEERIARRHSQVNIHEMPKEDPDAEELLRRKIESENEEPPRRSEDE
jgi:hypothetical protein